MKQNTKSKKQPCSRGRGVSGKAPFFHKELAAEPRGIKPIPKKYRIRPKGVFDIQFREMNNAEKVAIAQLIEVSVGRRPQVDPTLPMSPNVQKVYKRYLDLPDNQKQRVARSINHLVASSVLKTADKQAGAKAYRHLLSARQI